MRWAKCLSPVTQAFRGAKFWLQLGLVSVSHCVAAAAAAAADTATCAVPCIECACEGAVGQGASKDIRRVLRWKRALSRCLCSDGSDPTSASLALPMVTVRLLATLRCGSAAMLGH